MVSGFHFLSWFSQTDALTGPYAFMDVYDPLHICNHSDDTGRYAYAVTL